MVSYDDDYRPAGPDEDTDEHLVVEPGSRHRIRPVVWAVLSVIVGAVLVLAVLRLFVLSTYWIPSEAMAPTLEVGDRIVVNRLDTSPDPGDVIVHRRISDSAAEVSDVVKRVAAVGGQTIESTGDSLLVDGAVVDESYLAPGTTTEPFGPVSVPDGMVFVLGDNRVDSFDSRFHGPVPVDHIVGTVVFGA